MTNAHLGYTIWSNSADQYPRDLPPVDDAVDVMSHGIRADVKLQKILAALVRLHILCRACFRQGLAGVANGCLHDMTPSGLSKQHVTNAESSGNQPHQDDRSNCDAELDKTQETQERSDIEDVSVAGDHAVRVRRRGYLRPKIYKSRVNAIPIPTNIPYRTLPHDWDFDDYEAGPTLEDNPLPTAAEMSLPLHGSEPLKHTLGIWAEWRDYGWRMLSDYFVMYSIQPPVQTVQRFLAIPDDDMDDTRFRGLMEGYDLSRDGKKPRIVTIEDVELCSFRKLAGCVRNASPEVVVDAMLRGRIKDKYICLDPAFAEVPEPTPEDVLITTDIDSIIWVTPHLVIKGKINIHTAPLPRDKAPISHHNHVYVNVLFPPSDEERSLGRHRTTWHVRKTRLTSIPHTYFAVIGLGSGVADVKVTFPRMMHKDDTFRSRWVNNIPPPVLELWVGKVVIRALRKVALPGQLEYFDYSQEEMRLRDGPRDRHHNRQLPLTNAQLDRLQKIMRDIVDNVDNHGEDDLSMFGSFQFVLDQIGVKLMTHRYEGDDENGNAWTSLCETFPALDWEYMIKPANGAMYMDLGVGFHPIDRDIPFVGLWKLPYVRASFDRGGLLKGNTHHACHLACYGGIQAEMESVAERATHISYRQCYPLIFENVRRPGKDVYFCDDADAFAGNSTFRECMSKQIAMCKNARHKSFGVRDETRGSGLAIKIMLESVYEQAKIYCQWGPIVWVQSDDWFTLLTMRLKALRYAQYKLVTRQVKPPNLGIISSVMMNLVRSTTTSPIPKHSYIYRALKDLHLGPVMERFGMFFLHNFQEDQANPLPDVESEDDDVVSHALGDARGRKSRGIRKTVKYIRRRRGSVNKDFPMGENVLWNELEVAMRTMTSTIIRPWVWRPAWAYHNLASRMFVHMTKDFWLFGLNPQCVLGIERTIQTLEEAMRSWSLLSITQYTPNAEFEASSTGVPGESSRRGKLVPSFVSLRNVFFPSPQVVLKPRSKWVVLKRYGYLEGYHTWLNQLGVSLQQKVDLHSALDRIFDNVQCLPRTNAMHIWLPGSSGGPLFRTHPKFYRIVSLRKEKASVSKKTPDSVIPHVEVSNTRFMDLLQSVHVGHRLEQSRRNRLAHQRKLQKRSAAMRNWRNPPKRGQAEACRNIVGMSFSCLSLALLCS